MRLEDRLVVVTGASRGIGSAIARLFVREGARVVGCARGGGVGASDDGGGDDAALSVEICDVRREGDVVRFAELVKARHGIPDVLVNNAGTVARARLEELEAAQLDDVLGSNLEGTFWMTRAFVGAMRARKAGRIINIASISGRQGTAELTAYCAAKHGVVGFTRALAEEVRADGITVNAICPGSVATEMLSRGMPGAEARMSPEDIAGVALYLAAEAPLAMTGSCLDVFG